MENKLEQQIKDWRNLKELCEQIKMRRGLSKKETLQRFYDGIKVYYETYQTKFDYLNKPKYNGQKGGKNE